SGGRNTFRQMKNSIAELPMLTAPKEKEELIIYLVAPKEAISAVLMTERDEKQMAVYFVSRALQDFIVERPKDDSPNTPMEDKEELPDPWILFTDGSSCTYGLGVGLILTNPKGMEFTYALRFRFEATNNEAKYEALIAGLRIVEQMGAKNLQAHVVSQLVEKSIDEKEVLAVVEEEGCTWMTLIYEYLTEGILPGEKKKARAVRRKAGRYVVYRPVPRNPQQNLTPVTSPRPFYKWRIDIAGHFPEVHGKVKFLIIATDYFTKWIEVKPVATIRGAQIKKFVWDNIVCRFGLPGEIVSENGKFRDNPFKDWCKKLCIRQCFASVKHLQTNGLVERENRSLGEGIKAWLDERSKHWME
nr:reverse transcriptase domain-containing protein [Tanacetum cinerariifolium]